ncbi:MAG: hypothetical protein QOF69_80 [Solirubrobacteraceae bacterium]|nr:hypothetical protein [Solirubrobacteraceae bacterium]
MKVIGLGSPDDVQEQIVYRRVAARRDPHPSAASEQVANQVGPVKVLPEPGSPWMNR